MIDEKAVMYRTIDVPVVDGIATLPDGRTVRSRSQVVRVPYLTAEDHARLTAMLPEGYDCDCCDHDD